MKTYTFSSIAWKTTLVHTVTYFIVGLLSFLLLDYSTNYADPVISAFCGKTKASRFLATGSK